MNAHDIMTPFPFTISAAATLAEAASIMARHSIRHLPVIDSRHKVVGILSERDIERTSKYQRKGDLLKRVVPKEVLVAEYMCAPVYAVSEDTSLTKLAELFLSKKVSCFVVENLSHKALGIVTTDDMIKLFLSYRFADSEFQSISFQPKEKQ